MTRARHEAARDRPETTSQQGAILYNGHAGLGTNAKASTASGIVTDNKDPDKLRAVRAHDAGVIESVNVKYT